MFSDVFWSGYTNYKVSKVCTRCRGWPEISLFNSYNTEVYTFLWISPLTLDLYLIMLSVKQISIKYYLWVFGMTRPGIKHRSPGPLANTRTIMLLANRPGDLGSIRARVIPKTLKMVCDTSLFNTPQYKVRIKSKVEQSMKRSRTLPYTSV